MCKIIYICLILKGMTDILLYHCKIKQSGATLRVITPQAVYEPVNDVQKHNNSKIFLWVGS